MQIYMVGGAVRDALLGLPAAQAWIKGALHEQDFLNFEEPYRLNR